MASTKTNPGFMNGVPEILLLRLLVDREMYGYELVQAIESSTGEAIKLGEGVVYPVLHGLEEAGYLKARRKPVNGRTRVYYSLTAAGKKRLAHVVEDWNRITRAVSSVLKGTADAHA
ncbi:MAG TPA: PadR family transcriptional regulator [Polyangiaceae bacterium]|nr:PadR family transcriptional regulator [Polyangiaceae bacterium]